MRRDTTPDPRPETVSRRAFPGAAVAAGATQVTGRFPENGQPTMTIMAMAFRAADHIIQAARRGEV